MVCSKCNERPIHNKKRSLCARCYMAEYRKTPKYREKQDEYTNRETTKAGNRRRSLEHYHRNRDKWSDRYYQQNYGISRAERDALHEAQSGLCALCQAETVFRGPGGAHLDHCHSSGKIRAILCGSCNQMLGLAKDSPELLRAAALYIEKHRG